MRRDICRHADGDAGRAVDQQIREARGKNARFLSRFVKVRVPQNRFLVDIAQHLVAELRHTRLGVTIGRRGIAVNGTEVAVAVDKRIAHGEILRQTDHRVIDRRIAVRMIPAQHVADARCRLLERLVGGQTVLVHGVENAPVDGLQTVAYIGQRTADNDGHRVVDVRTFHLMYKLRLHDPLFGEHDILGLVVFLCAIYAFSFVGADDSVRPREVACSELLIYKQGISSGRTEPSVPAISSRQVRYPDSRRISRFPR